MRDRKQGVAHYEANEAKLDNDKFFSDSPTKGDVMSEPTVEQLKQCIESGHDYQDEPTCFRCGHYGPEDREHVLRLQVADSEKK